MVTNNSWSSDSLDALIAPLVLPNGKADHWLLAQTSLDFTLQSQPCIMRNDATYEGAIL